MLQAALPTATINANSLARKLIRRPSRHSNGLMHNTKKTNDPITMIGNNDPFVKLSKYKTASLI